MSKPSNNSGFSMIELLVAVLVMGIGVLGVTGLQMVSLQNNRDALLRTDALQMAYDILDRIRVNPGAGIPGADYDGVAFDDAPSAPSDCVANNCSAAQIAAFDIALWQCALGRNNEDDVLRGLARRRIVTGDCRATGIARRKWSDRGRRSWSHHRVRTLVWVRRCSAND